MKFFILICIYASLFLPRDVFSTSFPWEISAHKIDYAKDLELEGEVSLITPFGNISADRASIIGDREAILTKGVFTFIGDVIIDLKEGQKIFCDHASIDTSAMQAECLGILNPIKITTSYKESKTLSVLCERVFLSYEGEKFIKIQEIRGEGNVLIKMAGGLTASGEVIEIVSAKEDRAPSFYKLASRDSKKCLFQAPSGLTIRAPEILFSLKEGTIRFQDPEGECIIQDKKLQFSSHFFTWCFLKRTMVLEGKSVILLPSISWEVEGTINMLFGAAKDPLFSLEQENAPLEEGVLTSIEAFGNMVFSHKERPMSLTALGKAIYNTEDNQIAIEKEELAPQVHMIHPFGQIFSDILIFFLEKSTLRSEIEKMTLSGNVSLINKMFSSKEQEALQYILADEALFYLKREEALLKAGKGKRVLIMDKINRMQVSAPCITIKKSTGIPPFSIKGEGDVRFSFKEEELAEIKKRFIQK